MTKVRFTFVDVQGNPLPLLEFKILLRRASFNIEDVGVALPEELNVTTDASGQVIVELWPLKAAYRVQVADEYEELCGKLNWSFYVPQTDEIIEAQTLFLVPPPNNIPWDEEAMGKITQAVQDTQDNKEAAAQSAADAKVSAEAADVDADAAALSASQAASSAGDAQASKNAAKGSEDAAAALSEQARLSAVNAGNSANAASQSATAAANSASTATSAGSTAGAAAGTTSGTAAANAVVANKQDKHVNLTAFSGLTGVADRLPYFTGAGALALSTLTAKARELLSSTTAFAMRGVLLAETNEPIQVATSQIDLNTLITKRTDFYINDGINIPVAGNGYLTVIPLVGGTECHQTYRLIGGVHGIGTYERTQYGGNWSSWRTVLTVGDFGVGSQRVPIIRDFAGDIKPGFYHSYGSTHVEAPAGGPVGSGGGACGVVALQGVDNIGYKSFLSVTQYGGVPKLFVGSKIQAVAPAWGEVVMQESVTIDPAAGGLMSSTVVSGFTISKYANGAMTIQGQLANIESVPANGYVAKTVTIPSGFEGSILPFPAVALAPHTSNDNYGVTTCYMDSLTTVTFSVRNGSVPQTFGAYILVHGRWK